MQLLDAIGWVGTASQVGGALWLASRPRVPVWAYMVMTPGSAIWAGLGLYMALPSLVALNATFTAINLWGIFRWSRQ